MLSTLEEELLLSTTVSALGFHIERMKRCVLISVAVDWLRVVLDEG